MTKFALPLHDDPEVAYALIIGAMEEKERSNVPLVQRQKNHINYFFVSVFENFDIRV